MKKTALVVGGGIGGLLAAAVLSDHCEKVTILERDLYPNTPTKRKGVPQGDSLHVLLAAGFSAMESIFPDIGQDLEENGASNVNIRDFAVDWPGFETFPQWDVGISMYTMSRPMLEHVLRKKVRAIKNIQLIEQQKVTHFVVENTRITGVETMNGETYDADVVVDASGNHKLTLNALTALNYDLPIEEKVEIDISYYTAYFKRPSQPLGDWLAYRCIAEKPKDSRGFILCPIEGDRLICTLSSRMMHKPGEGIEGFFDYLTKCRTQTGYHALKKCEMIGDIVRHGLKYSRRKYFENLSSFPDNFIPIGDVLCQLNPIYGHGMSLAALGAQHLKNIFTQGLDSFNALHDGYFSMISEDIESAWKMSVYPDLTYPDIEGVRPADLRSNLMFMKNVLDLSAVDFRVHKLLVEAISLVTHQKKLLNDPELKADFEQKMCVYMAKIAAEAGAIQ